MGDISGGPTGDVGLAKRQRRPRRYITLRYLDSMGACEPAQNRFKEVFGEKALIADVVRALHRNRRNDWESWLLYRAAKGIVEVMLLAGAHINARDKHALRLAIWDRYTPRALFLLEHGARIPRKDLVGDELKWIMRVRKTAGGLLREWRDG